MLDNPPVDVADLLARAAALVPPDVANEAGVTVADVRDYLRHDEWGVALDILADLHTGWRPTTAWWDLLIDSAELMRLADTTAWFRWGRWESIHGIIRAELRLLSPIEGGRQTPIPGKGILRLLWDLGRRTVAGQPDLLVAGIWVEFAPALPPGATGSIRLRPLSPTLWQHLQPGMTITMHEGRPAIGTATIIEAPDHADISTVDHPTVDHRDGR